jgi:hypothetical protein
LVKKVEVQQREYQELMNKHVALQVQYMEQQRKLQKLGEAMQVQYVEQQVQLQKLADEHQDLLQRYASNWNLLKVMVGRIVNPYSKKG